jgi:hypothetical protein
LPAGNEADVRKKRRQATFCQSSMRSAIAQISGCVWSLSRLPIATMPAWRLGTKSAIDTKPSSEPL